MRNNEKSCPCCDQELILEDSFGGGIMNRLKGIDAGDIYRCYNPDCFDSQDFKSVFHTRKSQPGQIIKGLPSLS